MVRYATDYFSKSAPVSITYRVKRAVVTSFLLIFVNIPSIATIFSSGEVFCGFKLNLAFYYLLSHRGSMQLFIIRNLF